MSEQGGGARNDSLGGWVATHRFLVVANLLCVVFGVAAGWYFLPDWPAWKSLLAGLIAGAGCGFLFTCTRLVGGSID
jgi:hypothetical protein